MTAYNELKVYDWYWATLTQPSVDKDIIETNNMDKPDEDMSDCESATSENEDNNEVGNFCNLLVLKYGSGFEPLVNIDHRLILIFDIDPDQRKWGC